MTNRAVLIRGLRRLLTVILISGAANFTPAPAQLDLLAPAAGSAPETTVTPDQATSDTAPLDVSFIIPVRDPFADDVWGLRRDDLFNTVHDRADYDPYRLIDALQPGSPRVKISWQTTREENAAGFFLLRAVNPEGRDWIRLNPENPLLNSTSNTTQTQQYVFYDLDVEWAGTYYYRVFSYDLLGKGDFIIGAQQPVSAKPRALSAVELQEIRKAGYAFRKTLEPAAQQSTSAADAPAKGVHPDSATTSKPRP